MTPEDARPVDEIVFRVTSEPLGDVPRPAIGVDGPVVGADFLYDHHATGEPVNLLTIPASPPMPATLATTSVDTDAAVSAAVVVLRAHGEHTAVDDAFPMLLEASHYCDRLGPSGQNPDHEWPALGLHCWLKDRGMASSELRAWAERGGRDVGTAELRVKPSPRAQSETFRDLTLALMAAIRARRFPHDFTYLERLASMESRARTAVIRVTDQVAVLRPDDYLDPLAIYRVIDRQLCVSVGQHPEGGARYSIGVHPRAYDHCDLKRVYPALCAREPGWGGNRNAGGSPRARGSQLALDEVLEILRLSLPAT